MKMSELEERVTALERKVAQLAAGQAHGTASSQAWLQKVFGVFADDPEFEQAVLAGKEWRKTEELSEEEAA